MEIGRRFRFIYDDQLKSVFFFFSKHKKPERIHCQLTIQLDVSSNNSRCLGVCGCTGIVPWKTNETIRVIIYREKGKKNTDYERKCS